MAITFTNLFGKTESKDIDYNEIQNRPAIDGVTLSSTTTKAELGLDKLFVYKGQVASESNLPSSNNNIGDCYNVEDSGANYAWDGTQWDKLSETIDLSPYLTIEAAASTYATKEQLSEGLNTKQNTLNENQLAAVNSGITAEKVTEYDNYVAMIIREL